MNKIEVLKSLLEVREDVDAYALDTDSEVDVANPTSNEYVDGWEKHARPQAYILLAFKGKNVILAGSGNANHYVTVNGKLREKFKVTYDGNDATNPNKLKGNLKIVAYSNDVEGIKKFPKGTYPLYVMK